MRVTDLKSIEGFIEFKYMGQVFQIERDDEEENLWKFEIALGRYGLEDVQGMLSLIHYMSVMASFLIETNGEIAEIESLGGDDDIIGYVHYTEQEILNLIENLEQ